MIEAQQHGLMLRLCQMMFHHGSGFMSFFLVTEWEKVMNQCIYQIYRWVDQVKAIWWKLGYKFQGLSDDIYSFGAGNVKIRSWLLTLQGLESLEVGLRACLGEIILTFLIKVGRPAHCGRHHSLSWGPGLYEKERVYWVLSIHHHLLLDEGYRVSSCLKLLPL